MKYTCLEILEKTGIENPREKFGKMGITIGGVNANSAEKVINVQDATEVEVIVGKEAFTVTL